MCTHMFSNFLDILFIKNAISYNRYNTSENSVRLYNIKWKIFSIYVLYINEKFIFWDQKNYIYILTEILDTK